MSEINTVSPLAKPKRDAWLDNIFNFIKRFRKWLVIPAVGIFAFYCYFVTTQKTNNSKHFTESYASVKCYI